ncbi:MAG: ATP-binding cassette domain-containing protein [Geminicoccaceae bacterium]
MTKLPDLHGDGRTVAIGLVASLGVGQAVATGIAAFATRDVFAALHGGADLPAAALFSLAAAGVAVAAVRAWSRTIAEGLGQSFALSLRSALYKHLAGMSYSEVAARRSGALGLRFVGDLTAARNWVSLGLTRLISACLVLPGAAIALYLLNPDLALAAMVPVGLSVLLMVALAALIGALHRQLRSKRANIAIAMIERVTVAPLLDLMGRTKKELRQLDDQGAQLRDRAVRRVRAISGLRALPEIGAGLAGVAILAIASITGAPAAEAAGALAVLGILVLPLRELSGVWDQRCAWRVARHKCELVFAKPSATRGQNRRSGPVPVVFEGVHFRGIELDFRLEAGETLIVQGPVGSGKSSLLALAAGLETPDQGRVSLGDQQHRPTTVFLGSGTPILQGSLRRALTLGIAKRPKDKVIVAAAERFGLASVIDRLGGLDGRVSEGGRNLSSGERFRLLLSRTLLASPDVLILDAGEVNNDAENATLACDLIRNVNATVLAVMPDRSCTSDQWHYLKLSDHRTMEYSDELIEGRLLKDAA